MANQERLKLDTWAAPAAEVGATRGRRALVFLGLVALIAAAARVAVPLPGNPVPVTLQDLAIMVTGVLLGPVQGALAVATYVLVGALGAPVYANGGAGLAWLMGPTGGYLIAFPLLAFAVGFAAARGRPLWMLPIGVVVGQLLMYAGGVTQLALVTQRGASEAIALGVTPFLPGALFKAALLLGFAIAYRRWRTGSTG